MSAMIPHFRLELTASEKAAVQAVLDRGMLTQGLKIAELEQILSQQLAKKFGCAVASGTTALIFALRALKIGAGDEVIIPSYTCSALWHAVQAVQAEPIYADIETETYNLDPDDVRQRLTRRTKAIIFPHMFGQPGFIEEVIDWGLPVIEDIAQAYGATINEKPVGSFGTITIISFYATKIIGAGEGGAIFSDSAEIIAQIRDWREYDEKEDLHPRLNAKMTDLEAALALARLANFPTQFRQRQMVYQKYYALLGPNLVIPRLEYRSKANYYRCLAMLPGKSAEEVLALAATHQITIRRPVFKPLHLYDYRYPLPKTELAWNNQISLPIFASITDHEINVIVEFLKTILADE
jgi:dTDP-4-amino-4,6-dideoxygalactose transaminase